MKKPKSKMPKVDPYIEGFMTKLLDRLTGLEKKVDKLLGSQGRQAPVSVQPAPRRDRTLYEAICADCSKVCEVPFQPSENRAVYCKQCWARRKEGGARDSRQGMPVLTPVSLPAKPVSKLGMPQPAAPVAKRPKKAKISKTTRKPKRGRK